MAITFHNARTSSVTDRALLSISAMVSSVTTWNENRRTRAALSRLTTHELEDIGLTRGDIDMIGR